MKDDAKQPGISIVVHDRRLDSVAVVKAVRNALDSCLPYGCVPASSGTNGSEEATASFLVPLEGPDGREQPDPARAAMERKAAHCDLLDALGVPNGTKAIAIALHSEWKDLHRERFGEAAKPATVKRWRTARRRNTPVLTGCTAWPRRSSGPQRVVRGLRRHHAIRVSAGGGSVRDGYARAMEEIRLVNEGGHRFYGRPDRPLPFFTYEIFRRDCLEIRRGRRRS